MIKKARHINQVLGLNINVTPVDRLLSQLEEKIKANRKTFIVTLNPEMAILACKDAQFKDIINHADVVIPDGMGIVWALKRQGVNRVKRLSGADLMLKLIKRGYKTLLVGAKPGVAQAAAKKLGVEGMTESDVVEINRIKPDLLFVALGHGKQERWIAKNLPSLKVKLAMGVGGSLDQIAKPWLKAPKFIQGIGLEWLYRLIVQPWRLKRQLALFEFVARIYL
jgi:N-acetylglucosaminyldiphosphoundecaprenol N-acetyl-beta-D-mannosaminyltransferase